MECCLHCLQRKLFKFQLHCKPVVISSAERDAEVATKSAENSLPLETAAISVG